jgi:hypothetical protein
METSAAEIAREDQLGRRRENALDIQLLSVVELALFRVAAVISVSHGTAGFACR